MGLRLLFSIYILPVGHPWTQNILNIERERRHKIIEIAKDRVVEINTSSNVFLGSGFLLSEEGHVLTAYHVIFDEKSKCYRDTSFNLSWYTTISGQKHKKKISSPAVIDTFSINYDAAILEINLKASSPSLKKTAYFKLADSLYSRSGDDVLCVGFIPSKYTLPIAFAVKGMISTWRQNVVVPNKEGTGHIELDVLQLDMTAAGGVSGSPIIDLISNEVIAYMVSVDLPGDFKQSGFATAYCISNIKSLINDSHD